MTDVQMATIEWRVPESLPTEPPPKLYPTNVLPPIMREAVHAISDHVAAPEVLAGQCVIAAAAYLAQVRVNAPHVHYLGGMPCSLFQLALADSGDRKSECYRLAFKTIEANERTKRDEFALEMASFRKMRAGLKGKELQEFNQDVALPSDPRTLYTDATFERIAGDFIRGMPAAMWATDEGGRILGGHSLKAETVAATLGGLVKLFDSGRAERDRVGEFGNGIAYDRRFSVHMLAQEVTVRQALNNPLLQGQGFLPRFLMSAAPSLAGTRLLTIEKMQASAHSDEAVQRYWRRCDEIARTESFVGPNGAVQPPVINLALEAKRVWLDCYNRIEAEQGSLGEYGGLLKPFASRSGELARRVAAVFALFEGEAEISATTMKAACSIVEHSLGEWARYLGQTAVESTINREALELLSWLKERLNVRSVTGLTKNGPRKFRSAGKVRGLLKILTTAGWTAFPDGGDQKFEVNPHHLGEYVAPAANEAKSLVPAIATIGESRAKEGESDVSQAPAAALDGEARHDSPVSRHFRTEDAQARAPNSPNSPPPAGAHSAVPWEMTL